MLTWLRFVFIVCLVAVDDVLRELMMSFTTSRDFVRYRLRWIVQDKIRSFRNR